MNKIFFLAIAIIFISTGCKKNKPFISFTSENKRLVGEWKLDQISSSGTGVNGQTSAGATSDFYKPTVLKLNIDQTASLDGYMLRNDVDSTTHMSVTGNWSVSGEDITLTWDGNDVYNPQIQKYELTFVSQKELRITYQNVNVGGGISGLVSDFTFVYKFKK